MEKSIQDYIQHYTMKFDKRNKTSLRERLPGGKWDRKRVDISETASLNKEC